MLQTKTALLLTLILLLPITTSSSEGLGFGEVVQIQKVDGTLKSEPIINSTNTTVRIFQIFRFGGISNSKKVVKEKEVSSGETEEVTDNEESSWNIIWFWIFIISGVVLLGSYSWFKRLRSGGENDNEDFDTDFPNEYPEEPEEEDMKEEHMERGNVSNQKEDGFVNFDILDFKDWDMYGEVKDFYGDFPKLKSEIDKLNMGKGK